MFAWVKNLFASKPAGLDADARMKLYRAIENKVKARYDAAQITDDNKNHWSMADAYSAKTANNLAVRRRIRNNARYEIANNCWARGIVNRWANFLIGTGPRLQIRTTDRETNQAIETAWNSWQNAIGLPDKLRTMKKSKIGDGETFGMMVKSQAVQNSVKLDLQDIECDQVTTPDPRFSAQFWVDGVVLDEMGNAAAYHLLNRHPGDMYVAPDFFKYRTIPAAFMLHWFRKDRTGQVRGVSELAPGLELFALLRRFEIATVAAAEFAASLAGVMETATPTDGQPYPTIPFDTAEFERGLLLNLPRGHKLAQLKAEHPTTTFEMFERALLRQLASSLDIPFGIAVGDHSSYNYSSGRLDNQSFLQTIRVERGQCQRRILEPIFREWLNEATRIPKLLPRGLTSLPENIPHVWHWDGMPHVDPKKENEAKKMAVENNMQTLASVYAERGEDWEEAMEQIAREREKQRELDIVPVASVTTPAVDEDEVKRILEDAQIEEGSVA